MPRNERVELPAGVWTLLTTNDVAGASVQNISPRESKSIVNLLATVGAVPPTGENQGYQLLPGEAIAASDTLATIWSGVSGANRLYARSTTAAVVWVSHA